MKPTQKAKKEYTVKEPTTLLPFIMKVQLGKSRNKIKSQLTHRQVLVNNVVATKHDTPLKPGDIVSIIRSHTGERFSHPMLRIIHEDDDIIVIDKRNGLLSVGTDKERIKTAYHILSDYVKQQDRNNLIFIVHRLDRETSGLMVFARSEEIQGAMQSDWNNTVAQRRYVAVVEGMVAQPEGAIEACLSENKAFKVYVDPSGERAVTGFSVLSRGNEYTLLELSLETGKKNQIRAHLEHIGHPIAGDKKYGAITNPAGRVCLHAHILHLHHPVTGKLMKFETDLPSLFEAIVKKGGNFERRPRK